MKMNPRKVLIVDDRTQTREGLKALLATAPPVQTVGEAADGREARHLVEVRQPDVVLMDASMPVMDGLEATRRIKAKWPMAGLAADPAVVAGQTGLGLVGMALDAGLASGILDGVGGDLVHGGGPVVTQVAKGLRNQGPPGDQKGGDGEGETMTSRGTCCGISTQ